MGYTIFDSQDSSDFESGLSLEEATREFWSRNGGSVRDYFDARHQILSDEDFRKITRVDEHGEPVPCSVTPVKPIGRE